MIEKAVKKFVSGESLTSKQMYDSMQDILEGKASPAMLSAFLVALRMKGETPLEIASAARAMRDKAIKIDVQSSKNEVVFDVVGTGGARIKTFNISTCTAFVVAGCGIKVAKHGNRSASSKCGSADVLEKLGVNIILEPQRTQECIKKIGIGFMFAPLYHGSMKHASAVRRELKVRTIFNVLGPLCNPASAGYYLLGVYDLRLIDIISRSLKTLKAKRAFVVHGEGGMDEVSLSSRTSVAYLDRGKIRKVILKPSDFGKKKIPYRAVVSGGVEENAKIITDILKGRRSGHRDVVEASAACCLFLAGKVKTLKEGVKLASSCIDSGKAREKLEMLKEFTGRVSKFS